MSNLVDFIPAFQHIPTPMSIRGQNLHRELVRVYGGMIKDIEKRMADGEIVVNCLAKTMIETRVEEELDDLDMAILASAFMIGGVETVSVQLMYNEASPSTDLSDRLHRSCSGSPL